MAIASPNKAPKRKSPRITLDQAAASNPPPQSDSQKCLHCKHMFKVTGLAAHVRNCVHHTAALKRLAMSKPRRRSRFK